MGVCASTTTRSWVRAALLTASTNDVMAGNVADASDAHAALSSQDACLPSKTGKVTYDDTEYMKPLCLMPNNTRALRMYKDTP